MLKRGGSSSKSYSPYATSQRVKKSNGKTKLDILPNRPNVWLKQLSALQEQPRKDAVDAVTSSSHTSSNLSPPVLEVPSSCPGTPLVQHTKLVGSPSPMGTLKRPTSLSRNQSAAGFPIQSWVFSKGAGKSVIAQSPSPETPETTVAIEVEDIPSLLRIVERFAKAVEKLKDVVLEDKQENRRPLAHECLGEVLRILRQVISMYPLLNTVETLTAAGKLISQVKGYHYEVCNEADKKDFEKAIETIAVAFSSNVSELLMGEVDSSTLLSVLPSEKSRSMENLSGHESSHTWSDSSELAMSAEEVDIILQRSEGGVDSALTYAKTISKYIKDMIGYIERKLALELEFSKGLQRIYQTCKQTITQPHMPFFSIYSLALEQDLEQSSGMHQAASTLQNQTFIMPLLLRKQEHEKKRKEIKEQWLKAKRKLMECEANLRRAKQFYMTRCEEYDKARMAANRAEEEGGSSTTKTVDKKKRLEEEARNKAEEAEATYRTCIADATTQHQELEHMKVTVLRQIQEVIKQSDQTIRSATISYYQIMHMQTVALPVHYQTLCESSKLYDPGQQYATHVKDLQMSEEPETHYKFEAYSASSSQPSTRARADSANTDAHSSAEAPPTAGETGDTKDEQKRARGHMTHKSWGSTVSDTDSVGGGSGLGSPTTSTGDISKMARTSSTGTMSSNEDPDEKDSNVTSFETPNLNGIEPEIVVPTGPFRNVGLSKAAQTHKLRKLRSPSKCRECDSYVYFQGAECEECFLACHKRCLETLAIQCGHKKLQGRLQLFGQDFSQVSGNSPDSIPFIIKKCIGEIERRALRMKGIYRVNGVKTRVEKLCQAFENGKELVELSQSSPHDISNVLKLYLRQLPEPIMPFRLYNSLMGLAKESLAVVGPEGAETGKGPDLVDLGPETDPELLALVDRLKNLLKELPKPNTAILRYIASHLRRIAELEDDNKMSPSNLGIVFGPSLMRPRPSGATVSLSSLVDYPYQARIVETLIVFYPAVFHSDSSRPACASTPRTQSLQQESSIDGEEHCSNDEQGVADEPGAAESDKLEGHAESSTGTPASLEHSLDSDSEADEERSRGELQPPSPTEQALDSTKETQMRPPVLLVNLQCPSSSNNTSDPPALPESEPPELEEAPASSLAALNLNQSNNTTTTLTL
ncbi:minor histocompatibility protein HA-1-like isoform X3 [Sinocyclocheilus anshuiensis]|uniref:minor histocompatibility protein HA-1-like isoform X3 n=1 Tax=Sinocyclocheilus anshuiensis TaxID=1608454 RepID=UPI0007B7DC18|nr:PREDICTED: minor histocompatibility protein HA-1-like isoform X3 [Sinocyclocheilus anshuiensis]